MGRDDISALAGGSVLGVTFRPLFGRITIIRISMRGFVNREFSPRAKNLFLDALSPRFYPHSIQA